MSTGGLEIEVKFAIDDASVWRARLVAAGMLPVKPRLFERNVCFDNAADDLTRQGQLLRLRQDDGVRLTFKRDPAVGEIGAVSPDANKAREQVRIREELEVAVSDFATLASILERIGFAPIQTYEKFRETFRDAGVEVVLDELPFGHFLELEGDPASIRAAADRLGLDWEQRILENYLSLMARLREKHALPFVDLTFANFANLDVSIADVLGPKRP